MVGIKDNKVILNNNQVLLDCCCEEGPTGCPDMCVTGIPAGTYTSIDPTNGKCAWAAFVGGVIFVIYWAVDRWYIDNSQTHDGWYMISDAEYPIGSFTGTGAYIGTTANVVFC